MSTNKYADLPDIDTAPDVYETEDIFPSSQAEKGESSDDEPSTARARGRGGPGDTAGREELDRSHLISPDEASKLFRKAERKRRPRTHYAYPPSPSSSRSGSSRSPSPHRSSSRIHKLPLPARLRALQAELTALETELADPSNPALQIREKAKGEAVDPGEMIRGLVDVRSRLEKVRKGREGRGKLVGVVTGEGDANNGEEHTEHIEEGDMDGKDTINGNVKGKPGAPDVRTVIEMDKRVGELEKLVGSVSATLDEATPLTPPLSPLLTRLNNQFALLTQPRHIDSVSRRLKLLLSDLERVSASQGQKRQQSGASNATPAGTLTSAQDALLPLLTRLAPSLPHIPHILTRLRTLSALHASAAEFQRTLSSLEEEQRRTHEALEALKVAVSSVEGSLETNRGTVAANVQGLEERVEAVLSRLEALSH
ncbi:Dynamitin-domain-containing protein [Hygrophoropsis aurantiaca]|uniref:Dynamitin-domain-containing protein n=1 Tax=Hygrophoropsis aurantiaca TaxID=72124 RepID=A0ACB8ANR1_9AGAM|nr:Dynamitin-domain-containing protein [Hygrophoropsis aurantiaca]